jgi:sporulation protein YlmC with PRC-barrel domain
MEVARDIQDHQLVDRDDELCGRVDDVIIEWDEAGARLGALLSGGGILLEQLGLLGRFLRRVLPWRAAQSHVAIDWHQVRQLGPHHICLLPPRHRIGVRRRATASGDGRRLLSALLQRPVIDSNGKRMGILDVRTAMPSRPSTAPRVLGLLCAQEPRLVLLGLKRHDGGLLPRRRLGKQARFVPWETIASIDSDTLHIDRPFDELPLLADTVDQGLSTAPGKETA